MGPQLSLRWSASAAISRTPATRDGSAAQVNSFDTGSVHVGLEHGPWFGQMGQFPAVELDGDGFRLRPGQSMIEEIRPHRRHDRTTKGTQEASECGQGSIDIVLSDGEGVVGKFEEAPTEGEDQLNDVRGPQS